MIENTLNRRHNFILDWTQSGLQRCFTAARTSTDAALFHSEYISESKNSRELLVVAMLDAQKAFDVMDHNVLLRRLYQDGITGADWLLLCNQYFDLTTVMKWEGSLFNRFVNKQGVRQGGILSTAHYKRYNNTFTSAKIG